MPAWTPAFLGSAILGLWLRADTITGVSDGGALASWSDESGNGNHATQGTGANQPIYRTNQLNGLPGVDFAPSQWLNTALSASSVDESILAVVTVDTVASRDILSDSATGGRAFLVNLTGVLRYTKSGTGTIASSTATISTGTATIVGGTLTSTTATLMKNGTVEAAVSHATTFTGGLTSQVGIRESVSNPWDGLICELLATRTALTAANFDRAAGYLAHKWGLTGGLAADHTYKSAAPIVAWSVAAGAA